jgi:adenosine deaminase
LLSILAAIDVAFVEARHRHGIELRLILDGVRQWGPESMHELIRQAEGTRRYGVVAIGMGGDETSIPAAAFRTVFAAARRRGWPTTVHAGEAAGAAAVREAIEVLEVDRIEHGVAAATEPVLLDHLAARGIALDLCPTSHRRTGAVAADRPYPIRPFLDRGIPVTIGTDDPALFDTDLNRELRLVERECGLAANDLEQLQDNALQAAFLEPEVRDRLADRLLQERRKGVAAGIDTTPAGC